MYKALFTCIHIKILPKKYLKVLIQASFLSCFLSISASLNAQVPADIKTALKQQEQAWNNGDIDAFMAYYAQSDSTSFTGSSGVRFGWQNILNRYKTAYPDKKSMGHLSFKLIHGQDLGARHYLLIGEYALDYPDRDKATGFFSLVWSFENDRWLIVSDHTSASVKGE